MSKVPIKLEIHWKTHNNSGPNVIQVNLFSWFLWTSDQFIGILLEFISGNYGKFYNLATMVKLVIISNGCKTWHSEMCERIKSILLLFASFVICFFRFYDDVSNCYKTKKHCGPFFTQSKGVLPKFVTICKLVGFLVSHWTVMNQQKQFVWGQNCLRMTPPNSH